MSGSFRNEIALVLESAGIPESAFQIILGNEDYAVGKPDPAGYLMALHALGAVLAAPHTASEAAVG